MPFVHLHVHSDFSLLDGASKLPTMVQRVKDTGQNAIALTDHGVMHGAIKLVKYCQNAGIKPIIGNEMYVIQGDISKKHKGKKNHLLVLAKNTIGYKNLCKLTTISHTKGWQGGKSIFARPCINHELLEQHKEGLIIASGCLGGEVPNLVLQGKVQEAIEVAQWYKSVFGDDYYIEIQDHGRRGNDGEKLGDNKDLEKKVSEAEVNRALYDIAKTLNIKVIATNDSHFTCEDDFLSHNVLVTINANKKFADGYTGTEWIKSEEEMLTLFRDHLTDEEIIAAINNTQEIANKVEEYALYGADRLPAYQLPEQYKDKTPLWYLTGLANFGIKQRFNGGEVPQQYKDRLKYELGILAGAGFEEYFLVVWDFIKWAIDNGIPVGAGRGSAAGSLVAYALRITNVDPIKHGLMFERFLNPERKSMPDIDTDFCMDGRDKVIEYVKQKYGGQHCVQIATFNKLVAKSALKDIGKVMGISYSETDEMSKMIPVVRGKPTPLQEMISENTPVPDFRERYLNSERVQRWLDTAIKAQGTNKSTGIHAAGVVISGKDVTEWMPLFKQGEKIACQYDMEDVEYLGFLKFDFLGLKNLTTIKRAIEIINANTGQNLNPNDILAKDVSVSGGEFTPDVASAYQLALSGNMDGIFQLNSEEIRPLTKDLEPKDIEDLSVLTSIIRPGIKDLDTSALTFDDLSDEAKVTCDRAYVNRRMGIESVSYLHPKLEPILSETYGIPVYQEQIMKIAQELAGYTLGRSDTLRRAMGKKKKEEMDKQRIPFVEGCSQNGIEQVVADRIFDAMTGFSAYCFNKSHAVAYSYTSFLTLYLKANYPLEFLSALLTGDADTHEQIALYHSSATEQGIKFLPPDINKSQVDFIPEGNAIRFGLRVIRSLSYESACEVVAERDRTGEYKTFSQFCERNPQLKKNTVESLICAGAFDTLGITRQQLLNDTEATLKAGKVEYKWKEAGQLTLFSLPEFQVALQERVDESIAEMDLQIKADKEIEAIGVCLGDSPLKMWQRYLAPFSTPIAKFELGQTYSLLAEVKVVRLFTTRNGDPMAVLGLSDGKSSVEAVMFPSAYANCKEPLEKGIRLVVGEYKRNHRNDANQLVIYYIGNPENMAVAAVYCQDIEQELIARGVIAKNPGYIPVVIKTPQGRKALKVSSWVRNANCLINQGVNCRLFGANEVGNI